MQQNPSTQEGKLVWFIDSDNDYELTAGFKVSSTSAIGLSWVKRVYPIGSDHDRVVHEFWIRKTPMEAVEIFLKSHVSACSDYQIILKERREFEERFSSDAFAILDKMIRKYRCPEDIRDDMQEFSWDVRDLLAHTKTYPNLLKFERLKKLSEGFEKALRFKRELEDPGSPLNEKIKNVEKGEDA